MLDPCLALISWSVSVDHFVGPQQNGGGNGKTKGLGCFQIDPELELDRLLHGKIFRLRALDDPVDVAGERRSMSGVFAP